MMKHAEAAATQALPKVTYATMFSPTEALHQKFEDARRGIDAILGKEHPMLIGGQEVKAEGRFEDRSPINTDWVLGEFQKGGTVEAEAAVAAARAAFKHWASRPWEERVEILLRSASLIEERLFDMAALVALEVGKNRMEALGDVQETADLIRYCCDQMQRNNGYVERLPDDPIPGVTSCNVHVLRPHGVWVVIAPFNFPFALAGGPCGAALAAGNTVVLKPATDTPFSGWLLAQAFRDAGVPDGVLNFVTGQGATLGEALITHPGVDGITFTGSYDIGMRIYRAIAAGKYPRPCITEMGGKNAVIVSRNADLDLAALGIMRSAFGLQGQKCSACSRIYVEEPLMSAFLAKLTEQTKKINVGDPTEREVWMGPVVNASSYRQYAEFAEMCRHDAVIHTGGAQLTGGALGKGYFCAPTVVEARHGHPLFGIEMFVPITMVAAVASLEEAMRRANESDYGLTGGFYGTKEEAAWFFEHIQAGVAYANRPFGATTGAWPGFQPFGGWKGSGSTGRNAGGPWYLPQYMREQTRTIVEKV